MGLREVAGEGVGLEQVFRLRPASAVGRGMFAYLWEMRPYFRQVAGQLAIGSVAGILMNTAVVLPAILFGRAIDRALAFGRGEATAADVGWAAVAFLGGT